MTSIYIHKLTKQVYEISYIQGLTGHRAKLMVVHMTRLLTVRSFQVTKKQLFKELPQYIVKIN